MKKIKVIFPDGSIAEVEESDLQGALSAGAKRYSGVKKEFMSFPDGSTAEINEADINGAIKAGAVKKKETSNSVAPNGSPTTASQLGMRDMIGKGLSLQGAPTPEPEVSSIVDYWKEEIKSGDKTRIDKARNESRKLYSYKDPSALTAGDKDDITRLTGTSNPAEQMQVLDARLGKFGEDGNIVFPLLMVDGVDLNKLPKEDSEKLGVYREKLKFQLGPGIELVCIYLPVNHALRSFTGNNLCAN